MKLGFLTAGLPQRGLAEPTSSQAPTGTTASDEGGTTT